MSTVAILTADEIQRFHAMVQRSPGCWQWTGETNNQGYGRFSIYRGGRRVRVLAHRLAYFLATGDDPGRLHVRHDCDNPPCCKPTDLRKGTRSDNMQDAVQRGRVNTTGLRAERERRTAEARALHVAGKKTCSGCQTVKCHSEFHANRATWDGLNHNCKGCCADIQRRYRRRLRRNRRDAAA